ncbi:hypothetical protein HK405_007408, partial [Cladochytrium tenue]
NICPKKLSSGSPPQLAHGDDGHQPAIAAAAASGFVGHSGGGISDAGELDHDGGRGARAAFNGIQYDTFVAGDKALLQVVFYELHPRAFGERWLWVAPLPPPPFTVTTTTAKDMEGTPQMDMDFYHDGASDFSDFSDFSDVALYDPHFGDGGEDGHNNDDGDTSVQPRGDTVGEPPDEDAGAAAADEEFERIKGRLITNPNKAGTDKGPLTKEEIQRKVYEASKGSPYFQREEAKNEQTLKRIEELKESIRKLSPEQLRASRQRVKEKLEALENSRDLSRYIVHIDMPKDMYDKLYELSTFVAKDLEKKFDSVDECRIHVDSCADMQSGDVPPNKKANKRAKVCADDEGETSGTRRGDSSKRRGTNGSTSAATQRRASMPQITNYLQKQTNSPSAETKSASSNELVIATTENDAPTGSRHRGRKVAASKKKKAVRGGGGGSSSSSEEPARTRGRAAAAVAATAADGEAAAAQAVLGGEHSQIVCPACNVLSFRGPSAMVLAQFYHHLELCLEKGGRGG